MKYIVTRPGKCVCPTMEMPHITRNIRGSHVGVIEWKEWQKHLADLPQLDTSCTLPVGERFEGSELYQWKQWPNGSPWRDTTKEIIDAMGYQYTRQVIVPVEQGKVELTANYVYTQPDSHFWESLEMLMRDISRYKNGDINANYLLIGLQNTINQGYRLSQVEPKDDIGELCYDINNDKLSPVSRETFYKSVKDTREYYQPTNYDCFVAGYRYQNPPQVEPQHVEETANYIEGLKKLLRMADCPECLIEQPNLLNHQEPSEETRAWAMEVIEKDKAERSQPAILSLQDIVDGWPRVRDSITMDEIQKILKDKEGEEK